VPVGVELFSGRLLHFNAAPVTQQR